MLAGHPLTSWLAFGASIVVILAMELGIMSRAGRSSVRRTTWWCVAVIGIAALFGAVLWAVEGRGHALQFATGYVIEFSLSVDNLLVFVVVLDYFAVPAALQPTAIKWGILGAIVARALMIGFGTWMLAEIGWVIYVLGALLVVTGVRMLLRTKGNHVRIDRNPLLRVARRFLPLGDHFEGRAFLVRRSGRLLATPLLLVVLVIEWTDVMFATDSIPAIFSVTRDPFLVYTANILAIVGLRALFFVLSAVIARFAYLRFGVATVLTLVGAKMLAGRWMQVPTVWMLATIVLVLGVSIGLSVAKDERTANS